MILINKVTPFANETFKKDLIECILHNIDINFISSIIVFHNNSNIEVPNHEKVKLIIKNNYTDKDIIEYCKKIVTDDVFIFSNPFIKFNNTLINLETPTIVNKIGDDCFIFNRNEYLYSNSIESTFKKTIQNNKVVVDRKHLWTKEIQKSENKLNYQSRKVPNKIDAIIISVDYNDFLSETLANNTNLLNVTVVTSSSDIVCQELCKNLGVKCIVTDRMYEDNASFNKGKAINEGLKSLQNPDWILILDADIYLQSDFQEVIKNTNMNVSSLITCKRLIIDNNDSFESWKNGEDVGRLERAKGYGYFQLFNANCPTNRKFFYSEDYTDASYSDLEFRDRFRVKKELDTYVVHLGETNQNWNGRKTERFNNFGLDKILNGNLVFSLLKDLTFYNNKQIEYKKVDDNSQFIIHVSSLYKSNDYNYNRRCNLAQATWKYLYENENIIPHIKYENINNKSIPKIKDLFDYGYSMCLNDNDIIMYTNSDICLTEDTYQKVIESCNKYECTFSFRKDFLSKFNKPMSKEMVENTNYSGGNLTPTGADLFAVTKIWWDKWRDYLPDNQVIGRPTWDWIFRIAMGKSVEGDIVFQQTFEDQGTICETPNISYHEAHDSYWEKPENLLDVDSLSNSKIAYNWMKEKSNDIEFTGKIYFESTYQKNLI
jgi:hypothetical protein